MCRSVSIKQRGRSDVTFFSRPHTLKEKENQTSSRRELGVCVCVAVLHHDELSSDLLRSSDPVEAHLLLLFLLCYFSPQLLGLLFFNRRISLNRSSWASAEPDAHFSVLTPHYVASRAAPMLLEALALATNLADFVCTAVATLRSRYFLRCSIVVAQVDQQRVETAVSVERFAQTSKNSLI